jgi:hypothetical protein
MASWAPLIVHPTAHVGAVFFIILILSDSGAAIRGSMAPSSRRAASFRSAWLPQCCRYPLRKGLLVSYGAPAREPRRMAEAPR